MTVENASSSCDTIFIVNPNAKGGKAGKIWEKKIVPLLADERVTSFLGNFQVFVTRSAEEATLTAGTFAKKGVRKVVAVGGDDTVHNVVKGLLENDQLLNPDIHLGVLPLGGGNDFSMTLGIKDKYQEMIDHLIEGTPNPTDIAFVEYLTENGATEKNYFLNTASIGLSAEITKYLTANKKSFTTLNYAFAALKVCPNYEDPTVHIQINDNDPFISTLKTAIIANGNFCGKGMEMAPQAKIDDQQIDLILFAEGKITQLQSMMSKLKKGNHLDCEGLKLETASVIKISPADSTQQVYLEVNGYTPGVLPATFSVVPQQLNLLYKK